MIAGVEQSYAQQIEELDQDVTHWYRSAKVRPDLAADKPMLEGTAQLYVQDCLDAFEGTMVLVDGSLTWELLPAALPYGPPRADYFPSWEELFVSWKVRPA